MAVLAIIIPYLYKNRSRSKRLEKVLKLCLLCEKRSKLFWPSKVPIIIRQSEPELKIKEDLKKNVDSEIHEEQVLNGKDDLDTARPHSETASNFKVKPSP